MMLFNFESGSSLTGAGAATGYCYIGALGDGEGEGAPPRRSNGSEIGGAWSGGELTGSLLSIRSSREVVCGSG